MYLSRTYCKIILGLGKCLLRIKAEKWLPRNQVGGYGWWKAAEEGTRSISGLGGNSTDMREESKSHRKGLGLVWSELQWIHRIWLLFPLTRASLFCSLLSKCYFFMPPFNAIPTTHPSRRSRPQETSWRRFC